jgi:hypothetical protein
MSSLADIREEAIVTDTLRAVGSLDAFMMVKHAIIVQCDMYVNELRKLDAVLSPYHTMSIITIIMLHQYCVE